MSEQLLEIDVALDRVLAHASTLAPERVAADEADGRYLLDPVLAGLDLPPFTNSAMDGFALRAADAPGTLRLIGESAAGRPFSGSVEPGGAVAISTGAVLPDGADAVVPLERAELDAAATSVTVGPAAVGANVRARGSDAERGAVLLSPGRRLGPGHLAAAISGGAAELVCGRRPRVALLATGDELVPAGSALAPGEIHDSNGPMLAALVRRAGGVPVRVTAVADTPEAHRTALQDALEHDVVVSTGGVSVGVHDLVRAAGAQLGVEEIFWKVRMRPGKPLFFGRRGSTLVFGLPGNPVSTLVGFELFVAPALAALQGADAPRPAFRRARLAQPVARNSERDELIRVVHDRDGGLVPLRGQGSHQIAVAASADGLARIPAGAGELAAGAQVGYLPLTGS